MNIALVGCTGSIGRQTLDVVRRNPSMKVTALVAGKRSPSLEALAAEFSPSVVHAAEEGDIEPEKLYEGADVALIAAGGFAGLSYTLGAIAAGKKVALANKESLVCGGALVTEAAKRAGVEIVPVDSEHSAIFQALSFRRDAPFARLILTASGGPFLHLSEEELAHVTAADALRHPTWKMGAKITVDSATMLNKGYEVIEAKWLYGADFEQIGVVVHPESIVHSLVCFEDGAALAQLGYPDMRVPIQLALTYPDRLPCAPMLDLEQVGSLTFLPLPREKFPCFGLAVSAGKAGGTAPTVLNAAGEEAVHAFLAGSITFPQIAETIGDALERIPRAEADCYGTLADADRAARAVAKKHIYGK